MDSPMEFVKYFDLYFIHFWDESTKLVNQEEMDQFEYNMRNDVKECIKVNIRKKHEYEEDKSRMSEEETLFLRACQLNNVAMGECISRHYPNTIYQSLNLVDYFWHACGLGHVEFAEWMKDYFFSSNLNDLRADMALTLGGIIEKGNLKMVKWIDKIFHLVKKDIESYRCFGFSHACAAGQLEMLQWIQKQKFKVTKKDVVLKNGVCFPFVRACEGGNLDVVKFVCKNFELTRENMIAGHAFFCACENGHLKVARWIHDTYDMKREISDFKEKKEMGKNPYVPEVVNKLCKSLAFTCEKGHFEVIKWLYRTFDLTRDVMEECNVYTAIMCATRSGHLTILDWIKKKYFKFPYTYSETDILVIMDAFSEACENGHFDIVMCFHKSGIIGNRKFKSLYGFERACARGHFGLARWLYENYYENYDFNNRSRNEIRDVFFQICVNGHCEMARWFSVLFEINSEDVRYEKNKAFHCSCSSGHFEMVKLLCKRYDLTIEDFKSDKCLGFWLLCQLGPLKILKWLHRRFKFTNDDLSIEEHEGMIDAIYTAGDNKTMTWMWETLGIDCGR
jgi:hypothetical protein